MKILFKFLAIILYLNVNAQDTIYSDAYPKGIVVSEIDIDRYDKIHYPVGNPNFKVSILKEEIIKITNSTGVKFENPKYEKSNRIVVPVEPTTGKINYVGIIEIHGVSQKSLYNALKNLSSSVINYTLISSNEDEFTFLNYEGTFNTKFAGDPYITSFNLTLKFKDGKLKYDFHDFGFYFERGKTKGSVMGGDNAAFYSSHSVTQVYGNALEKYYIRGYRDDKFWHQINNVMTDAVRSIEKTAKGFTQDKDGF